MTSRSRLIDLIPRRLPPKIFRRLVQGVGRRPYLAIGAPPRSVLVVRTDEIGDLALTIPLLAAIRSAWKDARITVVAKAGPAQLVAGSPLVDDVIVWRPISRGQSTVIGQWHAWRFAARKLASKQFDLAVLPRRDIESGGARYVAAAARAQFVVGFSPPARTRSTRETSERHLLSTALTNGDPAAHELDHGRRLLEAIGLPEQPIHLAAQGNALLTEQDQTQGEDLLGPIQDEPGSLVAVALGAGEAKRRWTPARYARVLNSVHSARPLRVILLGGPQDGRAAEALIRALNPAIPVTNAVGRSSLRASLAVLTRSDLYLGGDTGTMHLASSVSTPCVVVSCHPRSGLPTSNNAPNRFGPWSTGSATVQPARPATGCDGECTAATAHCIEAVRESEVSAAMHHVLATRKAGMLQ